MARDWLVRGRPTRSRSWALEDHLFEEPPTAEREDALRALAARLGEEQAGLARIEAELHERAQRIAELERRLRAVEHLTADVNSGQAEVAEDDHPRRRTIDPRHSLATPQREYWLCRCEGFEVESPAGRIGVVDGLRFISRLDQPDLLEIRAGFLGRRLLLLPVDQVESISSGEERIVLRVAPQRNGDHVSDLLGRMRSKLSAGP
jgi:hypothetical protein